MARHTLYAYVDGSDVHDIADALYSRLAQFVDGRQWVAGRASVVNQKRGEETCSRPEDLPLWDLGLTLELPDAETEAPGWFADVEAIARFLGALHNDFCRNFAIGIVDAQTSVIEDLFHVSTGAPDLGRLRAIIGVGDIA